MANVLHISCISKSSRFETGIWVSQLALLVIGTISTFILFKVAIVPFLFSFIVSTLPNLWISLRSWLSPPYIYILLNFIILTIAASSSYQKPHAFSNPTKPKLTIQQSNKSQGQSLLRSLSEITAWKDVVEEDEKRLIDPVLPFEHVSSDSVVLTTEFDETQQENKLTNPVLSSSDSVARVIESDEARQEDVSNEDAGCEDSLEETWKSIMEKQGKMMKKQLNKCDTWNAPPRPLEKASEFGGGGDGDGDGDDDAAAALVWAKREFRKSDTFNDTVSFRRKKSMSQDELNRRAEEFINKFNHEIRMQRQESEQRFQDLVRCGL